MDLSFRMGRRSVVRAGLYAGLGAWLFPHRWSLAASRTPAKRCLFIWLDGGPSHIDTFDPKPGQPTGGPFKAIPTTVAGISFSEHLPNLAKQAKKLAVLRSLTSKEGDHERAVQQLHTGNPPQETVAYPTFGAVAANHWSQSKGALPRFVSIGGSPTGPGFLGVDFAPYLIENVDQPFENLQPPNYVGKERARRRLAVVEARNQRFAAVDKKRAEEVTSRIRKATQLASHPGMEALDLAKEKPETLARYGAAGDNAEFGKSLLLARKLLEQGTRFVEVSLGGWDTHSNNFTEVENLLKRFDPAVAALLDDLTTLSLLQETLVVIVGEFGRTPTINSDNGRDHWSDAFSAVLAGANIRGGQVLGKTDAKGEQVADRPITVPDFFATLLSSLGADPQHEYQTPEGRPIRLAAKGKVVQEIF